jgi:hypothetical protein
MLTTERGLGSFSYLGGQYADIVRYVDAFSSACH